MREQNRAKLSRLNIRIDYDLKDKIEREAEEADSENGIIIAKSNEEDAEEDSKDDLDDSEDENAEDDEPGDDE